MRYIFIILTLLGLSACSYAPETLENSYNNLGKEYARELRQMANFNAGQQSLIDDFGVQMQQWHKQQQLPAYALQGLAMALKTENPVTQRSELENFVDLPQTS
ncbi:MAG: hypothetical protein R3E55_04790 [Burkholderiaceae bacterium]